MAETVLNPLVSWGQNSENIYLSVQLSDVSDINVEMNEETLSFKSTATGTTGRSTYAFNLKFYLYIDADASKYRVTDRNIEFQIRKDGKQLWPRLTYEQSKPAWLKIDFDRFAFDEDTSTDEEEFNKQQQKSYLEAIEKQINDVKREAYLDFRMVYMVMYNLFQLVGFTMVVSMLIYHHITKGPESKRKAYTLVGDVLTTVQVCSVLEIVHPLIGWVKTGLFMPIIQIGGRNMILFMIIAQEPHVADKEIVWWLFMAWSSVELIRYPYYILQCVKKEVYLITWLRYTVWVLLYPIGFFCEGMVLLIALPYFEQSQKWTVSLPNDFNISFDFSLFLKVYMVGFFAGMYLLMTRMYEQRKKKLYIPKVKKS